MAPRATAIVVIFMLFARCQLQDYDTCRQKYLVAAKNTTNGTSVFFSFGGETNFSLNIPHFLPNECGPNYIWCGILLVEEDDQITTYLPAQGGFVKVTYQNEKAEFSFHSVEPTCSPVRAFHNAEHDKILLECLHIETEPEGTLYTIELSVSGNERPRHSDPYKLINTQTLSEALFSKCSILFTEAGDFLDISSCVHGNLEPDVSFRMENCRIVHHIDLVDGYAYVYCDVEETWRVSAQDGPDNFQFGLYPCPNSDHHVRIEGGKLVFNMTTASKHIDFPYKNLTFGGCVGHTFWAQVEGQLLSIPFAENAQPLNLSMCSGSSTCLRPSIDDTRAFGAYLNPDTVSVQFVNFTGSCGEETLQLPFSTPDMLHVALGRKQERCMCTNNQPTGLDLSSTVAIAVPLSMVAVVAFIIIMALIIWWKCCCGKGDRMIRKPGNDQWWSVASCCHTGPRTESRMALKEISASDELAPDSKDGGILETEHDGSKPMLRVAEDVDSLPMLGAAEDVDSLPMLGAPEDVDSLPMLGAAEDVDSLPMLGAAEDVDSQPMLRAAEDVDSQPMLHSPVAGAGSVDSMPVTCTPYEENRRDEPTDVATGIYNSHSRDAFDDNTVVETAIRDRTEEDINRTGRRARKLE